MLVSGVDILDVILTLSISGIGLSNTNNLTMFEMRFGDRMKVILGLWEPFFGVKVYGIFCEFGD